MKFLKFICWSFALIIGFFCILLFLGLLGSSKPAPEGMIKVPLSSSEIKKERVSTVKLILEDAGFTNIVVKAATNAETDEKGIVKRIQIDDSSVFSTGDYFPQDSRIEIIFESD